MSIKTPDNSLGEALAAILIMAYNPLTYRGYTFAPALSYNYYLGSRFYIPQLCRFMNADIYCDTETGVLGTNMFAYCNNNPISFIDPNGTYAEFFKAIRDVVYNYYLFVRAYNYCEKYIRRNLAPLKIPLQRFNCVVYNKNGFITLNYTQKLGNMNYSFNYNLIEHSVKEWYTIIYRTLRDKYILLDWVCEAIEDSGEYVEIANIIIQFFYPNWDILPYYEFAEFVVFLFDAYSDYRKQLEEEDLLYDLFFSPWEQYVFQEIKKYDEPHTEMKKLMLHKSIDCSLFTKRSFFSNRYDLISTYVIEPWKE